MVGWHHRFNGHEPGQTLGDGERQESLACCSPWGRKELDVTWQLNNNFLLINALFKLEANYFTILWWFLPYIDMSQPWCTWVPHPESPPPPSPSHPSGSSQCTSPEHPVSCIEPGPAIYFTYGNIHVSMLFSQIIPPLPSPTESKSLFFTFVSLFLSHI